MESLMNGALDSPYLIAKLNHYLPDAQVTPISSVREFFRGNTDVDALLFTAESGSAWGLVYPEYSVAIPQPDIVEIPIADILPRDDPEMKVFIDTWIDLKQKDLTTTRLYNHSILGKSAGDGPPLVGNPLSAWLDGPNARGSLRHHGRLGIAHAGFAGGQCCAITEPTEVFLPASSTKTG